MDINEKERAEELRKEVSKAGKDILGTPVAGHKRFLELQIEFIELLRQSLSGHLHNLKEAIDRFSETSEEQQAEMINLTRWIRGLTIVLAVLAVIQVYLLLN